MFFCRKKIARCKCFFLSENLVFYLLTNAELRFYNSVIILSNNSKKLPCCQIHLFWPNCLWHHRIMVVCRSSRYFKLLYLPSKTFITRLLKLEIALMEIAHLTVHSMQCGDTITSMFDVWTNVAESIKEKAFIIRENHFLMSMNSTLCLCANLRRSSRVLTLTEVVSWFFRS